MSQNLGEVAEGLAASVAGLTASVRDLSVRIDAMDARSVETEAQVRRNRRTTTLAHAGLAVQFIALVGVVIALLVASGNREQIRVTADQAAETSARTERVVSGALCPFYILLVAQPPMPPLEVMTPEQRGQYDAYRRVLLDGFTALRCAG